MDAAVLQALADLLAQSGAKPSRSRRFKRRGSPRVKPTAEETAARIAANDAECVRVFKAAGFKVVEPRFNVLTYGKWIEKGRRVRPGEKSHRVGPFSLFHEDQTDTLIAEAKPAKAEKKAETATVAAKPEAKAEAKAESATSPFSWNG